MNISQQLKVSFRFFSFGWQYWLALLLCSISVWSTAQNVQSKSTQVNGHSYDQNYLKWKAQQAAQDQRLSATQTASSSAAHYLARPTQQSAHSNQVRLNSASLEQLQQLSGVGMKKAQAIVEYRKQNRKFQSIEELQQVKGIGPALFAKNKHKLAL